MSESKPRCPRCYGMNGSLSVERRPDRDAICSCGWRGKYKLCFYEPLDLQDNDVLQDKVYHLTRKVEEQEHEIEALKAAYEQAQAKIKQLESQCEMLNDLSLENKLLKNQLCFTNSSWPHEKKLHEKIEQLKSDNEKLRAELLRVSNTWTPMQSIFADGKNWLNEIERIDKLLKEVGLK